MERDKINRRKERWMVCDGRGKQKNERDGEIVKGRRGVERLRRVCDIEGGQKKNE